MQEDGDHDSPLSPYRLSLSLKRVVNERIVRHSVQINSASLILSPMSPRKVFAAWLGRQSERGLDAAWSLGISSI